jgi:hypothetical protein
MNDCSIEFNITFDVLDAAINRCLGYMAPGVVEFNRKEITRGSIIYHLSQEQLGKIGEVHLDKLSDNRTQLSLYAISRGKSRISIQQIKEFVEGKADLQDKPLHLLVNDRNITNEFYERRKKHFDDVTNGLFQRLSIERIWFEQYCETTGIKEINLQTKPAGRKVYPCNPIAYDILSDGNENAEIRAFNYWCKEQGICDPGRRERDAFKKAMKRVEKRRQNR